MLIFKKILIIFNIWNNLMWVVKFMMKKNADNNPAVIGSFDNRCS